MRSCQDCTAPQYLAVHWSPVSETASRQHLSLAASHQLTVPPHWRSTCMAVGHLLSLVRRRGTHCQNVYVIPLLVLLFLPISWKHSSSQSTSVSSTLEALAIMRYVNLRFTLHDPNQWLHPFFIHHWTNDKGHHSLYARSSTPVPAQAH